MEFRDFIYLDKVLVKSFLAQAEGSVYEESHELSTVTKKRGGDLGVGAGPAKITGNLGKTTDVQNETIFKQTDSSEFDRLYNYFSENKMPTFYEEDTDENFNKLKRSQIVEVDARFQQGGFEKLFSLMAQFLEIGSMAEQLGIANQVPIDKETAAGIGLINSLDDSKKAQTIVGITPGKIGITTVLELDPSYISNNFDELDATAVLKIKRLLKEDETYVAGDPFGGLMKLLPEADQKSFLENFNSPELSQLGISIIEVTGPAIIGTPIAIYR